MIFADPADPSHEPLEGPSVKNLRSILYVGAVVKNDLSLNTIRYNQCNLVNLAKSVKHTFVFLYF